MHKKDGFTLLEMLIATAVLLSAAVGSVALISQAISNSRYSKNKLIAVNLAQEGIELVRVVRENNVLCDVLNGSPSHGWDRHPSGGGQMNGSNYALSVNSVGNMVCSGGGPTIANATPQFSIGCSSPLRLDSNGTYNYTSGSDTPFSRCVHVCSPPSAGSICDDALDPSADTLAADGDIPPPNQMDIVSIVTWQDKSVTKNVTLYERIYNWK